MSLVADLLSNVKPSGRKGEIPPNLKKVVADLSDKRATKKKIIIYFVLLLLPIAGGIGAVLFKDLYLKPKAGTRASGISVAELKNRDQGRPSSQAIDQKQGKDESIKETGNKVSSVSQPTADKQENIPEKLKIKRKSKIFLNRAEARRKLANNNQEKTRTGRQTMKQMPRVAKKEPKVAAVESKNRKAEPLNNDLQLYLARSYENKKDYSKAVDSYKQILKMDPDNYLVMNNISSLLLHLEAFEESIKYSEMALNIKEDYVPSLINLGIAYIKSGNRTAGEGYLLKVLSIEPSNKHALFNSALLYEKIGEYDKAYGSYQRLSKMSDFQGYLGLARIAEKQNRAANAIMYYTKLMSMEGIDPRIKKMANERVHMLR